MGKVIPVRIIAVDEDRHRIIASARQAASLTTKPAGLDEVEIGSVLVGEITGLHDTNLVLALHPSRVKALMSYSTLSRHRKLTVEQLRADLVKGQVVDDLVVVSKRADKGFVIVGLVPAKATAAPAPSASEGSVSHLSFDALAVGQVVSGRICGKIPTGILVQLARNLKGRVPPTEASDNYDSLTTTADLATGSQVQCVIVKLDAEYRRVELSLRASRIDPLAAGITGIQDPVVETVDDLVVGQSIRGFVKNIAGQGLFVAVSANVTARVQIKVSFFFGTLTFRTGSETDTECRG